MQDFKPTWLYVKQHNITGLKYFGKTVKKCPVQYKGSGQHWLRHLRKYGNDVTTVWYQLFTDKDLLVSFALNFSAQNNIVESKEWANLKPEDGLRGGGVKGCKIRPHSDEHKIKISEGVKRRYAEKGFIKKPPRESKPREKWSNEAKLKHSLRQIGVKQRRMCCIHCKKEVSISSSFHGNNCKMALRSH